jgi:hypothetical protein
MDAFLLGLLPHHRLLACEGFLKVEASSNGPGTIQKP